MHVMAWLATSAVLAVLMAGCAQEDAPGTPGAPTSPSTTGTPVTEPTPTPSSPGTGWPPIHAGALFYDGFEDGLSEWETDQDVPADPNRPGQPVASEISPVAEPVHNGSRSLRFFLDGRQDDGTIWIERTIGRPQGDATLNFSVWAWSPSESFNTRAYLVAYLGPADPEAEDDFPAPQQNSARDDFGAGGLREVLDQAEGWVEYRFTWAPPSDQEELHMAVGISAVWETEMTFYLDDLKVLVEQ